MTSSQQHNDVDEHVVDEFFAMFTNVPPWMSEGLCAKNGCDPIADLRVIGLELCPVCPVAKQCAEYAQRRGFHTLSFAGLGDGAAKKTTR